MIDSFHISQLRRGIARPFGPQGQPSAIDKQQIQGPVDVSATGLAGDEQGDPRIHGGPDKALHAYAVSHYPQWRAEYPKSAAHFVPGGFGENLVVEGATEQDMCLGDLWTVGDVVLQLSQSRQPCWKLNQRFEVPDMARRVQDSGRTGWYFRVLRPGQISAGMTAKLTGRPHPDWSLTRLWSVLYRDTLDQAALRAFVALPDLPDRWRKMAQARLDRGAVEDWRARLTTPD